MMKKLFMLKNVNPYHSIMALLLLTSFLAFSGCVSIPTLQDYTPISPTQAPAKSGTLRAAVSLVDNQSPTPSEREEDRRLDAVRRKHGRLIPLRTHTVVNHSNNANSPIGPERLTEILIQELSVSGFFASVDHEGAGASDVLIKPTLKWCTLSILGLNIHNVFDFELEVQVLKGQQSVMTKSYKRRWEKWDLDYNTAYSQFFPPLMKEIRDDIVRSLEG